MQMEQTMTILLIFLTSLLSGLAFGDDNCSKEFDVLIRGKKSKYSIESKKLNNFKCNNTFEGRYFKIVKGTSEEVISFDESDELINKAANVYYHLSLARNFWINKVKSQYVRDFEQITIRLEITNAYSRTRHFKNKKLEENFNNAWTTPAGETPNFVEDKKSWNQEIWFSPVKKLATREQLKSNGNNPIHESLVLVKDPVTDFAGSSLLYNTLGYLAFPNRYSGSSFIDNAVIQIGAMAVIYGLVETTKHMDKWFVNKYYYIDTAMVPDIIYHEFAHIALSRTMKPIHSVPVIEGMADYFATLIVDRDKMYSPINGISTNKVKKRNSKKFYHPYLEEQSNSESDFTLSLLWDVHQRFDLINEKRLKQKKKQLVSPIKLIHNAHLKLTEQSNIIKDLTKALIDSCHEVCLNSRTGISELHRIIEKKGF